MYLSKYPKRRWTKKPQKSLGRVVRVHSRSARPLPLSQRRDLLTLTKWFPPLKSNFLSPFEPSLEKSPLPSCSLVVRVHAAIFIKGKLFEALNTRLSHPLPLLPVGWQTWKSIINRAWEFRLSASKQPGPNAVRFRFDFREPSSRNGSFTTYLTRDLVQQRLGGPL